MVKTQKKKKYLIKKSIKYINRYLTEEIQMWKKERNADGK